ncbi:MAG TPA: DUF354 domain-containing protein [Candidatus Acidoferrales bacterium]|jgi:predicted glycosyltransferase|nr:DUF354 domain-containing protein [Candidatus Acidoferrales bacterium]
MSTQTFNVKPILEEATTLLAPPPADLDREAKHAIPPTASLRDGRGRRIWIDIDNSPHVLFFLPIIDELQKRGFQVDLTARDMYQVCELLEFFNLPCKVIGRHYGKNKLLKVIGTCLRVVQLLPTAFKFHASLALSHGSRAQILVCKALRIPTVMMHDYEFSAKTGFVEPDWVFTPEVIPVNAMNRRPERTLKYPGLKEDVYVPRFVPDSQILTDLGISRDEILVTLRPPATEAHYHNSESEELFAEALRVLSENRNVRSVVLPRNARQGTELRREWADLIARGCLKIPAHPVNGLNLIWFSDLVISGGGTMNREATALGVPVYSVFRGKIGAVDKYLAAKGRLTLIENIKEIRTKIILARWNRPSQPETSDRPALRTIIENIVMILEGKCQATRRPAQ